MPAHALVAVAIVALATAAPNPLQEITVRDLAGDACGNVVVHANAAIAHVRAADDALITTLEALRTDTFAPSRAIAETNELRKSLERIRVEDDRANAELGRLRELARTKDDPGRARILSGFVDALASAVGHQRTIAAEVRSFMDARDAATAGTARSTNPAGAATEAETLAGGPTTSRATLEHQSPALRPAVSDGPTPSAHATLASVQAPVEAILHDEAVASDAGQSAVGGC